LVASFGLPKLETSEGQINQTDTGRAPGINPRHHVCRFDHRHSPFGTRLHAGLTLVVFAGLGIGFYFAGISAATDRPAELDTKVPTSSGELRAELDSPGRALAQAGPLPFRALNRIEPAAEKCSIRFRASLPQCRRARRSLAPSGAQGRNLTLQPLQRLFNPLQRPGWTLPPA
jgi:hypothetical protein